MKNIIFSNLSRLFLLFFLVSISACTSTSPRVFRGKGIVTGQPGMNKYPELAPGETATLTRPYIGAPPMVPHSVGDFNISRKENDCLGCHLEGIEVAEGHKATKVPLSHYFNQFSGEHSENQVVGIRYNCLQCHVPQSSEEPHS